MRPSATEALDGLQDTAATQSSIICPPRHRLTLRFTTDEQWANSIQRSGQSRDIIRSFTVCGQWEKP